MTDLSKKQDAADLLQIDKDAHGILRVTLNDPARRNALSEAMLDRLGAILADAAIDASVRVIILAANGPAFCAGHDLKEMSAGRANADQGEAYFTDVLKRCSAVMQAILQNPKPVIAEVATTATAAGCQLVASCDLAYAAQSDDPVPPMPAGATANGQPLTQPAWEAIWSARTAEEKKKWLETGSFE